MLTKSRSIVITLAIIVGAIVIGAVFKNQKEIPKRKTAHKVQQEYKFKTIKKFSISVIDLN